MNNGPILNKELDSEIFLSFYYLKEELINFCRQNDLQTSGSKAEITDRIAVYLNTGEKTKIKRDTNKGVRYENITLDSAIEGNFICSEKHRKFYKENIGDQFSFNVTFQKWLKSNSGKLMRTQ